MGAHDFASMTRKPWNSCKGHVAAFLMILGFRLFWLGGLETWLPETLKKIILWIGEYSMGIFLTHWLVIASFSCWFYSIYSGGEREAGDQGEIWYCFTF